MKLTSIIDSSEKSFRSALETFFVSIYPENKLTSHGLEHHRRVWEYAKELLQYIEKENSFDQIFINKLLIACYLHDIGMTIDPGEKHGHHSRNICKKFLKDNNLNESDYQDLLSAIENHDDKEYTDSENKDLLRTILTVADDLDAFGETGITRYLEIYSERGMEKDKLGEAVRKNAKKRFENFVKHFSRYPELIEKYKRRYHLLDNYFNNNYLTTI